MTKQGPLFGFVAGVLTVIALGIVFTALEVWTPHFRTPLRVDIPIAQDGVDLSGWSRQQRHYVVAYLFGGTLLWIGASMTVRAGHRRMA